MTSLRKRLMAFLLPVFLAVAVFASTWTYYMFGNMVSMFMDNQMSVLAHSHAQETLGPPNMRTLSQDSVNDGALMIQIWDAHGRLVASSYPALALPLQPADGFTDVRFGERPWRV